MTLFIPSFSLFSVFFAASFVLANATQMLKLAHLQSFTASVQQPLK